jgi:hypothetical protein
MAGCKLAADCSLMRQAFNVRSDGPWPARNATDKGAFDSDLCVRRLSGLQTALPSAFRCPELSKQCVLKRGIIRLEKITARSSSDASDNHTLVQFVALAAASQCVQQLEIARTQG